MAAYLGMSVETLAKLYQQEIDKGRAVANLKIGQTLFTKAIGGDTAACIFWAKTQMGWKENGKSGDSSDVKGKNPGIFQNLKAIMSKD